MSRITIVDVARRAGVSKSTVSRVLRDDGDVSPRAQQRVQRAVVQLGYQPSLLAGTLRSRRSHSIGLVIPDVANPFFPELVQGVQRVADERGYSVLLFSTDWQAQREQRFLDLARRYHLDGILISPAHITSADLARAGCPVVVIGSRHHYGPFDSIGSDTDSALKLALQHLAGRGHRRIALVPGPQDSLPAETRRAGFRAHLEEFGLCEDGCPVVHAEFSQAGGVQAADEVARLTPRPTAVLCGNDLIALGMLSGLRAQGLRVPEDVSVIGIDDIPAAAVAWPALTTIGKDKVRLGTQAAQLLIDRIEGQLLEAPRAHVLPVTLVSRDSVASISSGRNGAPLAKPAKGRKQH